MALTRILTTVKPELAEGFFGLGLGDFHGGACAAWSVFTRCSREPPDMSMRADNMHFLADKYVRILTIDLIAQAVLFYSAFRGERIPLARSLDGFPNASETAAGPALRHRTRSAERSACR